MRNNIFPLPKVEDLNRYFRADFHRGVLIWLPRPPTEFAPGNYGEDASANAWNAKNAGKRALNSAHNQGYRAGTFLGRRTLAHRVIYKMFHGIEPDHIDHINGDRADNRICNLRSVSIGQNQKNQKIHKRNQSGVAGVDLHKPTGKWQARISSNNQHIYLGLFNSFEGAVTARKQAEARYGFHKNHGRAA